MAGTGFIVGCLLFPLVCGVEYGWWIMRSIHTFRHGKAGGYRRLAGSMSILPQARPSIRSDWALA
jgi:hypothetical protein